MLLNYGNDLAILRERSLNASIIEVSNKLSCPLWPLKWGYAMLGDIANSCHSLTPGPVIHTTLYSSKLGGLKRQRPWMLPVGLALLICMVMPWHLLAQNARPQSTKPSDTQKSESISISMNSESLLRSFKARPIGPASMSGRVTDVAVDPKASSTIYVATATGGVWKSTNNGTTWAPLFDQESTSSIGAIAIAPSNPEIIWVGTGEANARNSVSWGKGVFKSVDGGKSWKNMGLADSHHIAAVVIHPTNPDVVYVASLGHFWGPNKERGIFKTIDGGKNWEACFFIDEDCGCVDLKMNPSEPNTLWAAMYAVRRDGFSGGDPAVLQLHEKAGIYKSNDAGATWQKMTRGLPEGKLGRIGLDVYLRNPKVLYAVIQTEKTNIRQVAGQPTKKNADNVDIGGIFRSEDGGESWKKLNDLCPRPFYFGEIRVDPTDDQRIWVCGIPLFRSNDGGQTFTADAAPRVHADHHALWIDPKNPERLILGCDGGLYMSYDRGASWAFMEQLPLSQFYGVAVDMRRPYFVYGGLQDNGSWGGPSATRVSVGIGNYDWYRIGGGDGFQCQVDPTDWRVVYGESQYGNLFRIHVATGESKNIRPRAAEGTTIRFNWNSPMLLSPHNPRTLYYGGNYLFRSFDRGDHWQKISPDLTLGTKGSLTTISESPISPGLIWVGSDDGKIQLTRDGGVSWIDVSQKLKDVAADRTISRVEASAFAAGTCYVSIDRHRNDDYRPYLYKTTDYGTTWTPLHDTLPENGSVHVIREDRQNRQLLYCGTEFGLFVSLDGGRHWMPLRGGMPTVPIYDVVVHPRDQELVIGTHGRGIYIMDIAPLQELSEEIANKDVFLFSPKTAWLYRNLPSPNLAGARHYTASNPTFGAMLSYYLKETSHQTGKITITDALGNRIAEFNCSQEPGIHFVNWNLRRTATANSVPQQPRPSSPQPSSTAPRNQNQPRRTQQAAPMVQPGDYVVKLTIGDKVLTKRIRVEAESANRGDDILVDDEVIDDQ